MYILLLIAIIALILWKILYNFSIMFLFIPLGLLIIFFGFFYKDESQLVGKLIILAGAAAIILSIINKDLSIGVFVDNIPNLIMFWK